MTFLTGAFCAARAHFARAVCCLMLLSTLAFAQPHAGGEANLVLPDLDLATFLGDIGGSTLL